MRSALKAARLAVFVLSAGCGARTDPTTEDDSSVTPVSNDPAHTRGIDQVCSVVLAQSCAERSRAECVALFDRNRGDAVARGCGDVYDSLLACWTAHGAGCSAIGEVWNDGCQAAESAFDRCARK